MIRLLAMSPSGEAFFTRDGHGVVREHWRLGGLDPLQVSQYEVDRAVLDYGFERTEMDLETWADVETAVDGRIRRMDAPLVPSPATARALLPVLDRWLRSPADRRNVVPLVLRLLGEDPIREDAELSGELVERAQRADPGNRPTPSREWSRHDTVTAFLSSAA